MAGKRDKKAEMVVYNFITKEKLYSKTFVPGSETLEDGTVRVYVIRTIDKNSYLLKMDLSPIADSYNMGELMPITDPDEMRYQKMYKTVPGNSDVLNYTEKEMQKIGKKLQGSDQCSICGRPLGKLSSKLHVSDGIICDDCIKKTGYTITSLDARNAFASKTIEEIKQFINKRNEELKVIDGFTPNRSIWGVGFDDINYKLLLDVPSGVTEKQKKVFDYSQIVDFELLEDGVSIAKGGLGHAIAGGIAFGGVGAIVGGVVGHKAKEYCEALKVAISLNDVITPVVNIDFIDKKTLLTDKRYITVLDQARKLISELQVSVNKVHDNDDIAVSSSPSVSAADEIKKFKELLDIGAITEEEYEEKKKQLLGL